MSFFNRNTIIAASTIASVGSNESPIYNASKIQNVDINSNLPNVSNGNVLSFNGDNWSYTGISGGGGGGSTGPTGPAGGGSSLFGVTGVIQLYNTSSTFTGSTGFYVNPTGHVSIDNKHLLFGPQEELEIYYSGTGTNIKTSMNNFNIESTNSTGTVNVYLSDSIGTTSFNVKDENGVDRTSIKSSGNINTTATGPLVHIFKSGTNFKSEIQFQELATNPSHELAGSIMYDGDNSSNSLVIGTIENGTGGGLGYVKAISVLRNQNNTTFHGNPLPDNDNSRDIGSPSLRWDDIYATNTTIQSSDSSLKKDIMEMNNNDCLDFINRLTPKSFKWLEGSRTHYGLIAQDFEKAITEHGLDSNNFAPFIKSPLVEKVIDDERSISFEPTGEFRLGIRYTELISFLIGSIKQLKTRIEVLESS